MIYLKDKNLLFIKSGKVAGTSVEIALSANATDQDIVTPFGPFEDELKRAEVGGHFPVNWAENKDDETLAYKKFKTLKALSKAGRLPEGKVSVFRGHRFRGHVRADQIVELCGESFLKDAHVVVISRHPYDRLLSGAHFRAKTRPESGSVQEEVDWLLNLDKPQGYGHYFYNDELIADTVLRYENLSEDLEALEKKFGLDLVSKLPHTKHTYRTDRRPAAEVLTDEEKARCYTVNKIYFDTFGYER